MDKKNEGLMKRLMWLLVAVMAPALAVAQEGGYAGGGAEPLLAPGGSVGVQGGYYRYSENPQFMDLTANGAVGVTGAYQTFWNGTDVRLEGRFLYAPADYASSQGKSKNETNYSVEGRALIMKQGQWGNVQFAPYSGLGYRFLRNDGKDVNGYSGYVRMSNYLYLPVGLWAGVPVGQGGDKLVGNVEVGALLAGEQYSGINSGLYNSQSSGEEVRGSLAYRTGPWEFGPYAQFWRIGQSSTDCAGSFCGYEPKNFTREVGVQASYHF